MIIELIKTSFNHTTPEEIVAIENFIDYDQVFYIIGFGTSYGSFHIIAAVSYVMTKQGSFINWLAVTNKHFTKAVYGKYGTEIPF